MVLVTIVIGLSLGYALMAFTLSRRARPPLPTAPDDLHFVFMIPCLNEAGVIRATLDRLLTAFPGQASILVIDDGSEDATAEIVKSEYAGRVWLLQRALPHAREGKGMALNAGYHHLLTSGLLEGHDTDSVIICVVDADGRIGPGAIDAVAPYFGDAKTGAVQIGVRMYNAKRNRLCRMQDMEFVIFTEVFQRGKQWIGSVGLGGNGQFTRLSALEALGPTPWTTCLTEDLDLGIRLLSLGWQNAYCGDACVAQQAVPRLRRLVRQRSRWFQGHMQCMRLIPTVMRSTVLSVRATADLVYHLTSPVLVLLTSLVTATFAAAIVRIAVFDRAGAGHLLPPVPVFVIAYCLSFGLAPIFGYVYAKREPTVSLPKAVLLAHLYVLYAFMWFAAGWIGALRAVARRGSWAKTARVAEAPAGTVASLAPAHDAIGASVA